MSYVSKFWAKQSWSCARWQPSKTYSKSAESCTLIEHGVRYSRCTFGQRQTFILGHQQQCFLRMGVDWTLPSARKGKPWRDGRRLLDRSLRPGATALHRRIIEERTCLFLSQLLSTPKNFREHIDLLVLSINFPTSVHLFPGFKEN